MEESQSNEYLQFPATSTLAVFARVDVVAWSTGPGLPVGYSADAPGSAVFCAKIVIWSLVTGLTVPVKDGVD